MYLLFFDLLVRKLRLEVRLLRLGHNSLDKSLLISCLNYAFLVPLLAIYFFTGMTEADGYGFIPHKAKLLHQV